MGSECDAVTVNSSQSRVVAVDSTLPSQMRDLAIDFIVSASSRGAIWQLDNDRCETGRANLLLCNSHWMLTPSEYIKEWCTPLEPGSNITSGKITKCSC